ncbi:IN2-2 protein [Arthrobacter sp. Hiyo8]|nr:IN2-2 protein [Arthrobacter sp. Hiyo8]
MSPETTNVQLGDGLTVSPLGFGGMALTPVYGEVDPAASLKTLHHAVDAGISFIDTADIYGAGDNEELIAKLLRDRRDEVQLATKFGIVGNPREATPMSGEIPRTWPRRRKRASAAWAPTSSTSTTCTAATSAFRLWKPWRPWQSLSGLAKSGTLACRK